MKETKLNDNEVHEVARMQAQIDSYEMFIQSLFLMMKFKKTDMNYPHIHNGLEHRRENYIWKKIRDSLDNIQ